MPSEDLRISGHSKGNKIYIDPTHITANSGLGYPRLLILVKLDLNPLKTSDVREQNFTILEIRSDIFMKESGLKIADAISTVGSHFYKVDRPNIEATYNLEYPLDYHRVMKIEERRVGNLDIRINFRFVIALFEQKVVKDYDTPSVQLSIEIPQSHWIEYILPALGFGEYFLIKIPKGSKSFGKAWEYIENAEHSFKSWNIKGIYANCRDLGELLDRSIKDKFGAKNFNYKERWGRIYASFSSLASLALHEENINPNDFKIGRADAEHLLIRAKTLVKYAEELLREKNE